MKPIVFIFASLFSSALFAQPVIQDGNNRPSVGFTTPVSVSISITSPGSAGANQSWDYSSVSFSPMGVLTVVDPATSVYGANFPNANYCFILSVGGGSLYTYRDYSTTKMEELASSISEPETGQDYTPNPPTRLVFPMSLGTTAFDTWQRVGGSVNEVTITYDAYGTFVSPYNTYTDVVRVANDYGDNEIDYSWFTTNPLRLLAVHKHSDNTLILLDGMSVGTIEAEALKGVAVYPNPAQDRFSITWDEGFAATITFGLYDLSGARVAETTINRGVTHLERGALPNGMYIYRLEDETGVVHTGKITFN